MTGLGKYAVDILLAYGLTGLLVGGLILQTALAARAARRALEAAER